MYYSVPYGHLFTSLPRFGARNAPPTVLILLLLSLSHPGGGDNRPVRRLSQDQQLRMGWLAASTQRASRSGTVNDLGYRPNRPNAYHFPAKSVLYPRFLSSLAVASGRKRGREATSGCACAVEVSNGQAYFRLGEAGCWPAHTSSWTRLRLAEKRQKQEFSAALGIMQSGVQVQCRAHVAHTTLQLTHSSLISSQV